MSTSFEPGAKPDDKNFIPLCVPEIRGNEWKYVKECLDTGWVSSVGSYVDRFETLLAAKTATKHAVAVVNGTSALHIALLIAGVQPDDEVISSTLTFIAPANAIRYARAWPVFMDAEPNYWQMDVEKVSDFLRQECTQVNGVLRNKKSGRRIAAIMPVHVLGHMVDMDPLLTLARSYELPVIEDATECLGAQYKGKPAGSLGDVACFSFNGNKIITTGGGGMLVTNNAAWAKKAKYLTTQAKDDPIEYVHNEIGYNYRLTNVQAAIGCAQLEMLDTYISSKQHIANTYSSALQNVQGITPMTQAAWCNSISWMYTILIDAERYGESSRGVLKRLNECKLQTRPLWQPMHLSPSQVGSQSYHCNVSEKLHRDALSLPCSAGLKPSEQQRVIDAIRRETGPA